MKKENAFELVENDIIMGLVKEVSSLKSSLEKEKENGLLAQKKILMSMVEVTDDFERLLNIIEPKLDGADPKAIKWVKNFKSIYKSLLKKLEKLNVKKMNIIIGDEAHPVYHRIIDVNETNEYSNNAIMSCESGGYFWGKDVLREAEVVVAKNQ